MTDAHTVVPCGLAYVFAGGCALEPPPLTVAPPPTVLRALGSLIHCIMAFIIWEASFDLLTFVGAFNHLKRRSRESSSLEVFLAQ